MSRNLRLAAFLLAPVACLATGATRGEETPSVELRWALGALPDGATAPVAVRRDTTLEAGSKLKFLVEPVRTAALYLIWLDSSGDVRVLYGPDEAPGRAYVPAGDDWFEIEAPAGRETFFLLASATPLDELESMLERYETADDAGRGRLGDEVVAEIRRLHRAHRRFARPVAKPVMIGGQTRGELSSSLDGLALEIRAERFYGKTITIEH